MANLRFSEDRSKCTVDLGEVEFELEDLASADLHTMVDEGTGEIYVFSTDNEDLGHEKLYRLELIECQEGEEEEDGDVAAG